MDGHWLGRNELQGLAHARAVSSGGLLAFHARSNGWGDPVPVGGCDAAFFCPKPEAKGLRMGFLPNGGSHETQTAGFVKWQKQPGRCVLGGNMDQNGHS